MCVNQWVMSWQYFYIFTFYNLYQPGYLLGLVKLGSKAATGWQLPTSCLKEMPKRALSGVIGPEGTSSCFSVSYRPLVDEHRNFFVSWPLNAVGWFNEEDQSFGRTSNYQSYSLVFRRSINQRWQNWTTWLYSAKKICLNP